MTGDATQRLLVRRLLSLPSPVLRLMAGGGVVYKGGRTLDPRLQFIATQAAKLPDLTSLTVEEARRSSEEGMARLAGDPEPGVRWETVALPGPRGEIFARLYRPAQQDPQAPLMIWAHMGGGVLGSVESSHPFCTTLASAGRCAVLSVDYRLAPENRFPAGLEDILTAFRWGRDKAERFGAPPGLAAIGGDSAGGAFAAVACHDLRRAGEPQPALQVLVYPATDLASDTPSMVTYADAFPLSKHAIDWFLGHYLGPDDAPTDVRVSPLREKDLSGLAPAIVVTAGFDPLVDQGEAYARKLRAAGVPTAYRCYDSLAHGFLGMTGAVPCADVAAREIGGLVRAAFSGHLT